MSKKYNTLGEWAKDTCDAIRSKDGTSDPIPHGDIPDRIKAITTGSDVAGVTATPADVSENVKFVDSSGTLQSGTMPEIAGSETVLDSTTTETTIPAGHHGGTGKVKIVPDTNNTFTPTTEQQVFTPSSGKVYTKVIINASEAVDLSGVTASASDVLSGKKFMSSGGVLTDGTMKNNGVLNGTKSGSGTYTLTEGYYASGSKITVSNATSYQDYSSGTTARANHILKGYTCRSNGVAVTGTIESQAAQTITPGTSDKTISSGVYLSGTQTIKGDSNLVASNIKRGVSLFGITGTYSESSSDSGIKKGVLGGTFDFPHIKSFPALFCAQHVTIDVNCVLDVICYYNPNNSAYIISLSVGEYNSGSYEVQRFQEDGYAELVDGYGEFGSYISFKLSSGGFSIEGGYGCTFDTNDNSYVYYYSLT